MNTVDPFDADPIVGKAYDGRLVRRMLAYVRPHRRLLWLAIAFMTISTAIDLVIPYLTKVAIDRYLARMYYLQETAPAAADSLEAASRRGDVLRAGSGYVLVRAGALDRDREAGRSGEFDPGARTQGPFYVFPAEQRVGDIGQIRDAHWLVPERELGAIPPRTLLQIRGADVAGVKRLAWIAGFLVLLGLVTQYGHMVALSIAGQRSMYDLRTALFRHIQGLSLSFYDRNPAGRLVTRVTNDIEAINEMFAAVLVTLITDLLLLGGTIGILFWMSPRLALTALAVVPPLVVVSFVFARRVRTVYREARRLLARLNSSLSEDLSGIKVVQIFRQERARRRRFGEVNEEYFRANLRQLVLFGIFRPTVEWLAAAGVALVLVSGGMGVMGGVVTLGVLVAFVGYVRQMFTPIVDLSEKYNILQSAMAAAERIFGAMDTEPEIQSRATATPPSPRLRGEVVFENVSFAYTADKPVLRGVSFTVPLGATVAVVGPTGAGKTSILGLLCRFYDPDAGRILIDGVDLREIPIDVLRNDIAIVLQDAFIFNRTIEENIRLGKPLPHEAVARAAASVQADGFISSLPRGYDALMEERGATLSAGQKQLLCFARALAHDPRILILDEATASIDPSTESLIQGAIETLRTGRTSIIVAHRLSTIRNADQILVLDDAEILERGTHHELLERRGIYYNLHLLQHGAAAPPEATTAAEA